MQKPKMMIGEKGVKYGLIKTGPKQNTAAPSKAVAANVFGDDDSDDDVEAQVQRQAEKKRSAAKVQQMYEAALAEDPNAFDYDGVYDQMQSEKVVPQQQEKIERKSRYIAQLKEQAERRKREDEIVLERRQLKDRVKEDHLYEDKEVFVTSAYRKKLEETQRWKEEEKARELEEEKQDVRKVGHMGNFYANLMSKNVAFGGASASREDGTKDQDKEGGMSKGVKAETSKGSGSGAADGEEGEEEVDAEVDAGAEKEKRSIEEVAAKAGVHLDKYDLIRMEAERAMRARKEREAEEGGGEEGNAGSHVKAEAGTAGREPPAATAATAAAAATAATAAAPEAAAPAAGKRRHDDRAVAAARERYLSRKKQNAGGA